MKDGYLRVKRKGNVSFMVSSCDTIIQGSRPAMIVRNTAYGHIVYIHTTMLMTMLYAANWWRTDGTES